MSVKWSVKSFILFQTNSYFIIHARKKIPKKQIECEKQNRKSLHVYF